MLDKNIKITENNIEDLISHTLDDMGYEKIEPFNFNNREEIIDFFTLRKSLKKLNPDLNNLYLEAAIKKIQNISFANNDIGKINANKEILNYLKNGIDIKIPSISNRTLFVNLIDFNNIKNNIFNYIRQMYIITNEQDEIRPDIIIYINGLPLSIFEVKNIDANEGLNEAIKQVRNYVSRKKELYWWNIISLVSNGIHTRIGDVESERWLEWKQISVNSDIINDNDEYELNFEKNTRGFFDKNNILNIIKNYIHYAIKNGKYIKIIPSYHQYFCTEKCIRKILEKNTKKCGFVWHTQGSGKTITMLFLAKQIMQLKTENKYKIIFVTDRNDLDNQIFSTFKSSSNYLQLEPQQIDSRKSLIEILSKDNNPGIYMTTIQKFIEETPVLSKKDNIIVIADEAHRSHNNIEIEEIFNLKNKEFSELKGHAIFLREAFPNAKFLGFTGTPLKGKKTEEIFGDEIDKYTMLQAEMDKAVVPIKYEQRIIVRNIKNEKEKLNEIDKLFNEVIEDEMVYFKKAKKAKLTSKIIQYYKSYKDPKTISETVKDFWKHYKERENVLNGKAIFVAMDREAAIDIYKEMIFQNSLYRNKIGLVISTTNKDSLEMLKIIPKEHETNEIINEFKKPDSKYKILIVVDKLLTGYDVPDLDTIYIFKIIKWHNLMQTIARVNRTYKTKEQVKEYGLVVDYIGISKFLEDALTEYAGISKEAGKEFNVEKVKEKLIDSLLEVRNEHYLRNKIYEKWILENNNDNRILLLENSIEYITALDLDTKDRFFRKMLKINKWYKVTKQLLNYEEKKEFQLYYLTFTFLRKSKVEDSIDFFESFKKLKEMLPEIIEVGNIDFDVVPLTKLNTLTNFAKWIEIKQQTKNIKNPHMEKIRILSEMKEQIKRFRTINPMEAKKISEELKKIAENMNSKIRSMEDFLRDIKKLLNIMIEQEKCGEKIKQKWLIPIFNIISREEFKSKLSKNTDTDIYELVFKIEKIFQKYNKNSWVENDSRREKICYDIAKMLQQEYNYPPANSKETSKLIVDEIHSNFIIFKKLGKA